LAQTGEERLFCTLAAAGELSLPLDHVFADLKEIRGYLKEIRGLIHSQLALTDKGIVALRFLKDWREFLAEDLSALSKESKNFQDD
jgi:hypothetical protein